MTERAAILARLEHWKLSDPWLRGYVPGMRTFFKDGYYKREPSADGNGRHLTMTERSKADLAELEREVLAGQSIEPRTKLIEVLK